MVIDNIEDYLKQLTVTELEQITSAHDAWQESGVIGADSILRGVDPPEGVSVGMWRETFCNRAWRQLAKRYAEQLALLPQRGQSALRGFHEGAHDLGHRPSPQTAPRRPPHPAEWGVAPWPDFGQAITTGTTPTIGSFDDDVVDAEIIED